MRKRTSPLRRVEMRIEDVMQLYAFQGTNGSHIRKLVPGSSGYSVLVASEFWVALWYVLM